MVTTKSLFAADGLDERSLEFLAAAIEKNNLPGFDYYEFKRAVASLREMQLDEAIAHKGAFATASTVGVTKDKLIETAGYYRDVVSKEKSQFDQALTSQTASRVTARQEDIKRLRDQIERHKTEINRLQDEIGGYLNQIEQDETAVKTEGERLERTKAAFEKTHLSVVTQMDRDIENMHKYL